TRAGVRELPRRPADRAERRPAGAPPRRLLQHAHGHQPPRAAPLVCDPPAAAGRGSTGDPGAARPRAPQHDAALHARERGAVARGVSKIAPSGEDLAATKTRKRSCASPHFRDVVLSWLTSDLAGYCDRRILRRWRLLRRRRASAARELDPQR